MHRRRREQKALRPVPQGVNEGARVEVAVPRGKISLRLRVLYRVARARTLGRAQPEVPGGRQARVPRGDDPNGRLNEEHLPHEAAGHELQARAVPWTDRNRENAQYLYDAHERAQ